MKVSRALLAAPAAALMAAAVGCSDVHVAFGVRIDLPASPLPGQSTIVLGGSASLPEGSVRTGGTPTTPWVTCQPGPYSIRWSNAANGAQGVPTAWWDCAQDSLRWRSGAIPLAPGSNLITITYVDLVDSSQASIEILVN